MRGMVRAAPIVIALLAPLALLGAMSWLDEDTPPESVRTAAAAVLSEAQARTLLDEKPVAASLTAREGASIVAPAWAGLVVASYLAPGTVLTTGSGVANVGGVVRMAARTGAPFYRPLRTNDSGADVADLNRLLLKLGHITALPEPADRFTLATAAGVRSLERGLGVTAPTGDFDPGWVVWLPFEPFEAGESSLVTGAPAPAPGQSLAKEPSRLLRVTLAAANPGEALALDPMVEWVFVTNRQRFGVDPRTLELEAAALPEVQKLLKPKQERLDGLVQRAEPLNVVAIPSTAVQVGRGGDLCAWVPESAGYRAVPVKVASARASVTNVTEGLSAGARVLANPADVLDAPQCPSP